MVLVKIDSTTANIGFGIIGAGRCNLHLQQHSSSCSGWTFFNLAFCCYLQHQFFNWALVPGGRFSNPQQRQALFVVRYFKPTLQTDKI
jgi:hypothetical protein